MAYERSDIPYGKYVNRPIDRDDGKVVRRTMYQDTYPTKDAQSVAMSMQVKHGKSYCDDSNRIGHVSVFV